MSDSVSFAKKRANFIVLIGCLLMLGVGLNIFFLVKTASLPLLDQHAFRQTQTALTTYWPSSYDMLLNIQNDKMTMGGLPISAIVDANNTRQRILQEGKYDIFANYQQVEVEGCTIYYR
jgi:hypothetical protein